MINQLLLKIDKPIFRPFLKAFIKLNYLRKRNKIQKVDFLYDLKKWYYELEDYSFLSSGPGWAYSYEFLLNDIKNISCYHYLPKEGDTIIDLGAGLGEETIIYSSLAGLKGHVYSIEAHPEIYTCLKFILNKNKLKNASAFNLAISDKNDIVKIETNEGVSDSFLANSINATSLSDNYFEVNGYTLDTFVENNQIKKIDLLKANIEGAEQLLIKGMKNSVHIVKNVALSCHDFRYENGEGDFYKTKEKVINFLKENNFKVSVRNTGNVVLDDYVYGSKQ